MQLSQSRIYPRQGGCRDTVRRYPVRVFATVLKTLTGLRTSMATLIKTYCLLTGSCASLGFAIESFSSSVDMAMSSGIFVNVILMIVGVINPSGVNPDDLPNRIMQVLAFFSPIKWDECLLFFSSLRAHIIVSWCSRGSQR